MLKHAFRFVELVAFEIGTNNLRSRRSIEKTGARELRSEELDNTPHVIYGLGRHEFVEGS